VPIAHERQPLQVDRRLDGAVFAAVRCLHPDERHEAIRALGWSPLAYARAEQHALEEVEVDLASGRLDRLAALLSALHERALSLRSSPAH
jgi:hypothetical protein